MKKLFAILLLFVFVSKANAQLVTINNLRTCYIDVLMKGHCPGGACDGLLALYHIPPGKSTVVNPATPALATYYVSGGSCAFPGAQWHGAEIQTVSCDPCSGYGVAVGDGTCPNPVTGIIYFNGPNCAVQPSCVPTTQCAVWMPADGGATINAY